jgi:hypothetical protein
MEGKKLFAHSRPGTIGNKSRRKNKENKEEKTHTHTQLLVAK